MPETTALEIVKVPIEEQDETYRYDIFADVAEILWPGNPGHSNHSAQDRVADRLRDLHCPVVPAAHGFVPKGSGTRTK